MAVDQVERPLSPGDGRACKPLREDLDIDVVVAGSGTTGLTAALLLASDKRRVALLEARHQGAGTTGSSCEEVTRDGCDETQRR